MAWLLPVHFPQPEVGILLFYDMFKRMTWIFRVVRLFRGQLFLVSSEGWAALLGDFCLVLLCPRVTLGTSIPYGTGPFFLMETCLCLMNTIMLYNFLSPQQGEVNLEE